MKNKESDFNEDTLKDLKKLKKSLSDKSIEKNNILTLFRKGIINEDEVEQQVKEIKKEEAKLLNLIEALEAKVIDCKHEDDLINNMASKLKLYHDKIDRLTFEEKYELVKLLVKSIEVGTVITEGKKVSDIRVTYNLVKFNTCTDKDSYNKFDIEKEFLPIIYKNQDSSSRGIKLRTLRLSRNMTIKELSKATNISTTTLMHVEQNKISVPYYYWKKICDYFDVNNIEYLELLTLPEKSIQDKLWKIRIVLGAKTWSEVGKELGYSSGFISDMLNRYTPTEENIKRINDTLNRLLL